MPFGNPQGYQNNPQGNQPPQKGEGQQDKSAGVLLSTEEYQKVYNLLTGLNDAIPATDETAQVKQLITEVINLLGGKMQQAPQEQNQPPQQVAG